MTDIHCHILYGVDDGAKNVEDMKKSIDTAYSIGIRNIFTTPHYNPELFKYDYDLIIKHFEILKEYVLLNYPDMTIQLGHEVFIHSKLPSIIFENKPITLGNTNYVLIETYPDQSFSTISAFVAAFCQQAYRPVLAHVERYNCLDYKKLITLSQMGALITINAESIVGDNGKKTQRVVLKYLKKHVVDFVCSDAHNVNTYNSFKTAYEFLKNNFKNYADDLFINNAKNIFRL